MTDFAAALGTRVLVADGAMGTVLHAAGNPLDRALPELNLSNATLVRWVHDSYLQAGVDIIQTNTFGANRLRLDTSGLGELTQEINTAGVRVALEAARAAGRPVFVGGSVSPAVTIQQRRRVPPADRAQALREQIASLVDAGVDLIVLETFGFLDELVEAATVATENGAVPVIAQATFAADGHTLSGHTPAEVCAALGELPVAVLGTNCTLGPQRLLAIVGELRAHTGLPIAAQPNAGLPRRTTALRFEYEIDPEYVARYAERLVEAGATIVGGCCGTTPAHLEAVVTAVRAMPGPAPEAIEEARPQHPPAVTGWTPRESFVVAAEIEPPPAGRVAEAVDRARALRELGVDTVYVAAGDGPRARLDPVNLAVHLQHQLAVAAFASVTTWDKTIMALQADLLGAHALGVRRIVCETGNPPLLGDYPHVDGVWDVDSVGLVELLAGLNAGLDCNGLRLAGTTSFEIGARINPGARDLPAEARRALRKIDAGAHFLITRPVYELERLRRLRAALGAPRVPVLASIRPLGGFAEAEYLRHEVPDVTVPPETLSVLQRAGDAAPAAAIELAVELVTGVRDLVDGVLLALPDGPEVAGRLLAAAR
ncbi:bifunctional homocysteine S-methyltransferase/methylenetetrahydrofolate reductase [Pseudonocardia acidicola]|uniref:Bifunctional homocysteine S-methyltransferase/methylenetetrahydrofolate reductase n=1 Tax=Pseudonocardia acidicola TaxID=2724939 RepID=A0ABX1SA28_9PSEU|nr:bifunctional homocysteine S-methyltransferase/methylenetetrahydrofolate reductase [Pseudonocardia acidicola]NMH97672.1 bifunctional homocysteine S-methyltransferase/methylenetetrahydrofolate reductase [Pseudonocardia acidicola]